MATTELNKINGTINGLNTNSPNGTIIPINEMVIEIYKPFPSNPPSANPGIYIGGVSLSNNLDNNYSHFAFYTQHNLNSNDVLIAKIIINKKKVITHSVTYQVQGSNIIINLNTSDIESLLEISDDCTFTIKGSVTLGEEYIPAIYLDTEEYAVIIQKTEVINGIITLTSIAQADINYQGKYEIKFREPLTAIFPNITTGVPCEKGLSNYTVDVILLHRPKNESVVHLQRVQIEDCCNIINLHISDPSVFNHFYTEIDYYLYRLGAAPLDTENYSRYAEQYSLDETILQNLAYAQKYHSDLGLNLREVYVLCKQLGLEVSVWAFEDPDRIEEIITRQIESHIIALADTAIVDTQKTLHDFKLEKILADKSENNDSLEDILNPLFQDNKTNIKQFLSISLEFANNDIEGYNIALKEKFGTQAATMIGNRLQTLAVTGRQPEITRELIENRPPLSQIALTYTENDWIQLVSDVCAASQKLCIPLSIQEEAGQDTQLMKEIYGKRLFQLTSDIYATAILGKEFANGSFSFSQNPQQIAAFITQNPDWDLREKNIWSYDFGNSQFPTAVRTDLIPVQNLLRITGGQPKLVTEMLKQGIYASSNITDMSQEAFVSKFAAFASGPSFESLETIYTKASSTSHVLSGTKTGVEASFTATPAIFDPSPWLHLWSADPGPSTNPNLETLFGSLDLCSCAECTSMYSPAAYLTDILNFIKNKIDTVIPTKAYDEFIRRRPDLIHIDLTCKNTNTVIPYIDLVNELLELKILKFNAIAMPADFKSYQTSGTTIELEAYPEHTYKKDDGTYEADGTYEVVYDSILKESVFPHRLPFDLPLEESRTYLSHLGYTRHHLIEQFRPVRDYTGVTTLEMNDYNAAAELLSLSRNEADIITKVMNPDLPADTLIYYGFPGTASATWIDYLMGVSSTGNDEGLNAILNKSDISYKELLELLTTDFLNKKNSSGIRALSIQAKSGAAPDTCQLAELELIHHSGGLTKTQIFDLWYRFIRLKKATGWTIYQLDMMLKSIHSTVLDKDDFIRVSKMHRYAMLLNAAPEKFASFWNQIDTGIYTRYNTDGQTILPSVYDTLFRNKTLVNPPETEFDHPDAIAGTYQERSGTIVAAFNIKEEEFIQILNFLGIDQSDTIPAGSGLAVLSRVLGISILAQGLNITVRDCIRFFEMNDISGASLILGTVSALIEVLDHYIHQYDGTSKLVFSLQEVAYLINHKDEQGVFIPSDKEIQLFYETLRGELKKLIDANESLLPTDLERLLKNVGTQIFSSTFNLDRDTALYIVNEVIRIDTTLLSTPTPLIEALIQSEFINAVETGTETPLPVTPDNGIAIFEFAEIFSAFQRIKKIALLVNRYKLSFNELTYFISNATLLNIIKIDELPVSVPLSSAPLLEGLIHLNKWVYVKGTFNLKVDEYINLLSLSSGGYSKEEWKTLVIERTGWDAIDLQFLIGDDTVNGVLKTQYSDIPLDNDFKAAAVLMQLHQIMSATSRIGLTPQLTYNALLPSVQMMDSRNIRKAAKAKHNETEWSKVAKPLQDTLREQQRKAMLAYLVSRPLAGDPITSQMHWKNEDGLFAYYLIDVEMQPCMKTSRIKQAIGSVQLYMDRLILNLENTDGEADSHISIRPDYISQWRSWRKWYRIWEANRKVFLYPENWIEPELRDNKTPFFKDFENQLLQDEVKDELAEEAFRTYLEQVEEVGRLEPVSSYQQIEREKVGDTTQVVLDRTHVFARTFAAPHRHYYRYWENNEWSPWEKVNLDIKSDHVIPVVWNRKLYIFWLTFKKKKNSNVLPRESSSGRWIHSSTLGQWITDLASSSIEMRSGADLFRDYDGDKTNIWEITLNWSQYKDNKWLATEISNDVMSIDMQEVRMSPASTTAVAGSSDPRKAIEWLNNRHEIKIDDFFKNRLYFFQTFEEPNAMVSNYQDYGLNFSIMFTPGLGEIATGIHSFFWRGDNSKEPFVLRADYERGYQIMAPTGTRINKNKFVEDPFSDGKLRRDNTTYTTASTVPNNYFSFSSNKMETQGGIVRGHNSVILNTTSNNGMYKVTARADIRDNPSYHFHNPLRSHFMFDDTKNTFFVRWEKAQISISGVKNPGAISLGTVDGFVSTHYTALGGIISHAGFEAVPGAFAGGAIAALLPLEHYRFYTFYHAQIHEFVKMLNRGGISTLLQIGNQEKMDTMAFSHNYLPTDLVSSEYPKNNVQFDLSDAYSIYNWEIFFHSPMLIAQRLSDNQQFEEAQKWYHYIFNPTSNTDINGTYTGGIKRFWKFYPFYQQSGLPTETLADLLAAINDGVTTAVKQVTAWENNPFNPHLIARMRILAYMKNVLMKYLDNLIAWGDQLFRRDTIESINEATQLYVLAANLLGERPQEIPPRAISATQTFDELSATGTLDAFSNALVEIEGFFAPSTGIATGTSSTGAPIYGQMFYFCLPKNEKLTGYWDTVADRLFKIRNCMNIEGTVRQLPLFEPPIDPALLVRASAMGVDINSVLDSVSGNNLPHYRFSYMLQKANEFCNDVKNLGGALLSALEKKDGEQLALLRSSHELKLMERIQFIREQQVTEATESLEAVRLSKNNIQLRYDYYNSRPFKNANEEKSLRLSEEGLRFQAVQVGMEATMGAMSALPSIHLQSAASGISQSERNWTAATRAVSAALSIQSIISNVKGSMAATVGGYERRKDDWEFQAASAALELEQIDKQIIAAEIRLNITQKELANHELQMEQTSETDAYMRSKFSNQELYSWMSNQVSTTYFQSYQLAYDLAKKAEEAYTNELPVAQKPAGGFIKFGYWDSLRKGLLSGERLQFDLRKMEATYMDENRREHELTKHFSLAMINPEALLNLRENGICNFSLDSFWYDLDFPGHYLRKIKSVSVSIPCITGPYTTVAAQLTLTGNTIHKTPALDDAGQTMNIATSAIATSNAQNDAGVFELSFRDERYIPFENAGAISEWTLQMMTDVKLRQFDYDTISDVIVHVNYTSRNDDARAIENRKRLDEKISTLSTALPLPRYFSLKHEFNNEWFAAFNEIVDDTKRRLKLSIKRDMFPFYAKGKDIQITLAGFILNAKTTEEYRLRRGSTTITLNDELDINETISADAEDIELIFDIFKVDGSTPVLVEASEINDLYCILTYKLGV